MKYLQVIIPLTLFILAAGLIMIDFRDGENGTLTVIGGILGFLFVISLLLMTLIYKRIEKWRKKQS